MPQEAPTKSERFPAPIQKVGSVSELLPALKRGAKAAIYDAPPVPNGLDFENFASLTDVLGRKVTPQTPEGHHNGISTQLSLSIERGFIGQAKIYAHMMSSWHSPEQKAKFVAVLTFIADDIVKILKQFPGYEVEFSPFDLRVEKQNRKNRQGMHPDRGDSDNVRIIRVYQGPSTIYTLRGGARSFISGNDGSISAHKVRPHGPLHMSPEPHKGQTRVVIVLTLKKLYQ